jgi:phage shock protein A
VTDLQNKIRQAKQKQTLLLARMVRAESQHKIDRAMERATNRSAFAQFNRLEQRVERAEAMAEAYARLDGRDPEAEELDQDFTEADRKHQLDLEFSALRQRVKSEPAEVSSANHSREANT